MELLKRIGRRLVPARIRRPMSRYWRGVLRLWHHGTSARRLQPVSRLFGLDRGQCIDRFYIESFLRDHSSDIRGRVLEIADNTYTRRFGGDKVRQSDILYATPGNPSATLVGDLSRPECMSGDVLGRFDCLVLTQTFSCIFDIVSAVRGAFQLLAPEGVLLATVPGISQISRYDADRWGDYWRFTVQSAQRLFSEHFDAAELTVESRGNVAVACAFLQGLAVQDIDPRALDFQDPDYPVLITIRARRST